MLARQPSDPRSHEKSPEIVYHPDMVRGGGLLIWRSMFREFWMHRELITRLIARDLSARYRQPLLGVAV